MLRYITLSSLALTMLAFGCDDSGETVTDTAGDATPIAGEMTNAGEPMAGEGTMPDDGGAMGGEGTVPTAGTMVTPVGGETGGMDVPPVGGMDMPPMPSGGDCDPAFIECMNGCEDQACQQGCFTNAPSETQTLYNAFQSCIQMSGCQTNGCVLTTCGAEFEACYGPLPMGDSNCNGIFECLNTCPEGDQSCPEGCINNGTIDAQIQFSDIQQCFIESIDSGMCSDDDSDCYISACESVILMCEGIGGGGGGGTPAPNSLSCGGTILCLQSCEPTDMACQTGCANGLAMDQETVFNSFLECAETNCSESTEMGCVEMNCATELEACFPAGDKSCNEVLTCIEACTDSYCISECELSISDAGTPALSALAMCLNSNMCTSFDCEECATEYDACVE